MVSVAGVPAGNDRIIKVAWLYANCEERNSAMINDLGMCTNTGVIKDREKGARSQEPEVRRGKWRRSKE